LTIEIVIDAFNRLGLIEKYAELQVYTPLFYLLYGIGFAGYKSLQFKAGSVVFWGFSLCRGVAFLGLPQDGWMGGCISGFQRVDRWFKENSRLYSRSWWLHWKGGTRHKCRKRKSSCYINTTITAENIMK
jgi:hypothetical protein